MTKHLRKLFGVSDSWYKGFMDGLDDTTMMNIMGKDYRDGYDMGQQQRRNNSVN